MSTAKQLQRMTKFQKFEASELAKTFGITRQTFIIKAGKVTFEDLTVAQVLSVDGEIMLMWDGEWNTEAHNLYGETFSAWYDLTEKQFEQFESGKRVKF